MTEQRQTQRTVVREPSSLGYPVLAEIVRRIVDTAHPDSIILFGSAARGETGPDSDLDLLVVKTGVPHRRRLAQDIHMRFAGLGVPVDVIVVSPEDVQALRDDNSTVIGPALREGILIYAA
jgi:predicted nucleotidyltransferase